jgi:hypothetical protein
MQAYDEDPIVPGETDPSPAGSTISENSNDFSPSADLFSDNNNIIQSSSSSQPAQMNQSLPSTSSSTWMENIKAQVRKLESVLSSTIRKEKSPSLSMTLNNNTVYPTIDEGSEINVVDFDFATQCNLSFSRTTHQATAAGSQQMTVVGETKDDVVLHKNHDNHFIRWNLRKCIVVRNLGCPVLIGEPGKQDNVISTLPSKKLICTKDVENTPIVLPYQTKPVVSTRNFICRSTCNLIVQPGETVRVDTPTMFNNEKSLIFTPRLSTASSQLPGQICPSQGTHVSISNLTGDIISIKKNEHFGDILPTVDQSKLIYDLSRSNSTMKVQSLIPKAVQNNPTNYLDKVSIDPDNILNSEWKQRFRDIINNFSDIITPIPGAYNGYFGDVDCSLNFIQDPPASNKARLPGYSHDKLVAMSNIMDEMEKWGVLKKPHDLGITVRTVHTSYLVPKTDGSYRFVTDFTSLLPFIGKIEVVSPTIPQAKRMLSSFKYFVELDLSHCFWQGKMSPADSCYLATPHPFGGLRVYSREPQGIRNASEHNSERLSVIFGDLEKNKKMTRMANGLYVGGDNLYDLSDNLIEVFTRARNCGLTFKPSKVIICPESTILFGWKKKGNDWSPTNHVISPLACSPPPKTVKQLRGWVGAYRQVSETIQNHSITLTSMEKETAGKNSRDEIKWSVSLLQDFQMAKDSLKKSQSISFPNPSDTLHIYPDFSQDANAVGGHLIIERKQDGSIAKLNGGYFSVRLSDSQSKWSPCEKETLGIKLNIEHFKPFIQESYNTTIIHPDNMISVHAWNRLKKGIISTSSKVAAFLSCLSENNIDIIHCPGIKTKVADYSSRHPLPCNESRCQICKYMTEQCIIGEQCNVNSISVQDILSGSAKIPLTEKPAWVSVQKNDDMHKRLYKLITSGGLQPEKKLRGHTHLKLMYNLYRKGLLKIDSLGLIVVKHIDTVSGVEYEAISIPTSMYPSIIQSLHLKLQHPSRSQMHKFMHRYFHCTGSTVVIDHVHKSCQVCTSLSALPSPVTSFSTEKVETLGSQFSADVLVSDNQKIFLCREKLSQFTFSKIIEDETSDTFRTAILDAVLDLMPTTGTTVRVDAASGLKSIQQSLDSLENDDVLAKFSINLEIGRIHNVNKNPIAENCIKEFRKERLRLNPRGGPISEQECIIITRNMNSRIRNRGDSAKEMLLKRDNVSNSPISIQDSDISSSQFSLRSKTNSKHNSSISKPLHNFSVGERVFIINDLSKLRSREEYIISSLFRRNDEDWARINKTEKQFRQKPYEVKLSEIIPVSNNFSLNPNQDNSDAEEYTPPLFGFSSQEVPSQPTKLREAVQDLQVKIPAAKGRPKVRYPDYIVDNFFSQSQDSSLTEPFHGFPTQSNVVYVDNPTLVPKDVLLHGYIESSDEDEDEDFFYECLPYPPPAEEYQEQVIPTESDTSESDDDISDNVNVPPNYISSDDDPANQHSNDSGDFWWECPEESIDASPQRDSSIRLRSDSDPYFLMRAQLVSTDVSSLESDSPNSTLTADADNTLTPSSTVFDFSEALDKLHSIPTDSVVDLEDMPQPTPLPRL